MYDAVNNGHIDRPPRIALASRPMAQAMIFIEPISAKGSTPMTCSDTPSAGNRLRPP